MGSRRPAGRGPAAAGKREGALLRTGGVAERRFGRQRHRDPLRRLPGADRRQGDLRIQPGGVHAARPFQQGIARQAHVPRRGTAAGNEPAPRAAGRREVEMSALAIDVHGLNKSFGPKHVVKDFSLEVRPGEIYGFLGPNGSGKTTSIRMICGLLRPDSGHGTCLGYDIRNSAAIKREVGYMTQRFSLCEDLTIRENLDFVASMYDMNERKRAVQAQLEELGLETRQDQLAGTLSGGWKQRLALAACMLHRPRLLLLDEPTAGVDPQARRDFWEEIHRLAAGGIAVLVSTHYMDEAERCHSLAYIAYGKLLATGTPDEVLHLYRLSTWEVSGPSERLSALNARLKGLSGVSHVTAFGNTLHVTGEDAAELEKTLAPFLSQKGLSWEKAEPGLEDVFIHLMRNSGSGW